MMTTSATRFASSTSVRWPSCSAPMVGTNEMLFPLARRSATTCRISEILPTACISEAVFRVRVGAVAHIARPRADRRADVGSHLGVALEEFRLKGVVEAEHVGQHQHLTVTLWTGADANGRNAHRAGN